MSISLAFFGDSTVAANRNGEIKKPNRVESLGAGWAGQLAAQCLLEKQIDFAFNFAVNGAVLNDLHKQWQQSQQSQQCQ